MTKYIFSEKEKSVYYQRMFENIFTPTSTMNNK